MSDRIRDIPGLYLVATPWGSDNIIARAFIGDNRAHVTWWQPGDENGIYEVTEGPPNDQG